MKIATLWCIGIAFLCAVMTIAFPFLIGAVRFSDEPPWTDRVTKAEKVSLGRATGLALPRGSRFVLYGEDDGLDQRVYYKLRLNDHELHTLLAQRPFQGVTWSHEVAIDGGAASFPGWNPGQRPKTRSTQVSFERKPGDEATYLDLTIDPNGDGTDDVYVELGFS